MKKAESKLIVRFDNHMELTKGTALSLTIQTENDERCTSVRFKGPLTVDAGTEIAFTCSVADQNRRSSMECARVVLTTLSILGRRTAETMRIVSTDALAVINRLLARND